MHAPDAKADLTGHPFDRLVTMEAAGLAVQEATHSLGKAGLNVVGECLRGDRPFYELEHYPADDVYDHDTRSQYYYHHHRDPPEHGHFHTFMRPRSNDSARSAESDETVHLIAISMDDAGSPIGLFATNQWVTGETMRSAAEVVSMLNAFSVDHAFPNLAVNRWITALVRLFSPQIAALLRHRDEVIRRWPRESEAIEVLEDRALEVTGEIEISVDEQLLAVRQELARRKGQSGSL